ncbi:MAG: class I SAM-dependent methyltransferase [Solirubrobacteraceae bacterium]|jgi:2-polyprenyl-3-methyl-5-hydroxy-6-metoxy-1,4-benzoquinol methylase
MSVSLCSADGDVQYRDSADHFENGVLRLMNLSREEFGQWLDLAAGVRAPELLDRLREAWMAMRPPPEPLGSGVVALGPGNLEGHLLHAAIAETPSHGVAVSETAQRGWLVRWDGAQFSRELAPPVYEEEYFEGDKLLAGGYGDYTAQGGWRLEKAARQVSEMRRITGLAEGRVLDVGSGYGFFRVALGEAGYSHEGLEVSDFARAVASASYALETHAGTLEEHWEQWGARYHAVTLFDLIEHLVDPEAFLTQVAAILHPGGFVGVKTPNLDCPEAGVFGPWYHSLKREHLAYFTPRSLTAAAAGAGLESVDVATLSHLLVGFVGADQTRRWERELRGADIVAWYRLPAAAAQTA